MTRGEVAERVGVNPETLRYYERKDLIPMPPRSDGGFRLYDESYVDRLRFIQRAKDLGFTLAEIRELLDLRVDEEATCRDVRVQAEAKIEEVEAKIDDLKQIRDALSTLAEACGDQDGIVEGESDRSLFVHETRIFLCTAIGSTECSSIRWPSRTSSSTVGSCSALRRLTSSESSNPPGASARVGVRGDSGSSDSFVGRMLLRARRSAGKTARSSVTIEPFVHVRTGMTSSSLFVAPLLLKA